MTSNRPYLLRALHEWILDNAMTPHLLVDTTVAGTIVPKEYIEDNKIILNINPEAVRDLLLGNDGITFSARFGGKFCRLSVPVNAVIAIYARENGKGLVFGPEDDEEAGQRDDDQTDNGAGDKPAKPHLKVIK
jgi:stringent starvation protein B